MKKLLLVDDNKLYGMLLSSYLTRNGYKVVYCSHASEALELAKETSFDLIVSDLLMPEIDGIDFVKILKEKENIQNVPLIMLSAYESFELNELIKHLGVTEIIHKSFKNNNILQVIKDILNG